MRSELARIPNSRAIGIHKSLIEKDGLAEGEPLG
jgi:hypothetical protein